MKVTRIKYTSGIFLYRFNGPGGLNGDITKIAACNIEVDGTSYTVVYYYDYPPQSTYIINTIDDKFRNAWSFVGKANSEISDSFRCIINKSANLIHGVYNGWTLIDHI